MARFTFDLQNKDVEIEVTRQGNSLHVARGEQTFELLLKQQDGSSFLLEMVLPNGIRRHIHAAGHTYRDQRQLWVDGHTFHYSRVRQRGTGSKIDGSLSSSIPAIVSQILVDVGDTVAEGDKLILLESMKMVIPIQAPSSSTIKAIHCATGDSIQAGVPLIELENIQNDE